MDKCKRCEDIVMIDQYGQPVPALVLIDQYAYNLDDQHFIRTVIEAPWYDVEIDQGTPDDPDYEAEQPTTYLMAPFDIIQPSDTDAEYFIDADGRVSSELGGILVNVMKVNDILKRWSEEDGFYHV